MKRRPVNLNLFTLHFPVTAWVSILHRLSGFLTFLLIPALLYCLQYTLGSEAQFKHIQTFFHPFSCRVLLWFTISAYAYHIIAGIRHLLMDVHIGDSKEGGRQGAWLVMLLSLCFALIIGVRLW